MNRLEWPFNGSGNLEIPWPSAKCAKQLPVRGHHDKMGKLAMKIKCSDLPALFICMSFYVTCFITSMVIKL
jgi:hypothetical protein